MNGSIEKRGQAIERPENRRQLSEAPDRGQNHFLSSGSFRERKRQPRLSTARRRSASAGSDPDRRACRKNKPNFIFRTCTILT